MMYRLLVKNATQLVVVQSSKDRVRCGDAMNEVEIFENGAMVVDHDGKIVAVGSEDDMKTYLDDDESKFDEVLDASGKAIIPGLCDGHTHATWSGDRVDEFVMKLAGATYMEIHNMGKGIGYTLIVKKLAGATYMEIRNMGKGIGYTMIRLIVMLAGATYMEIHNMGKGIGYTVEQTKQSPEDELLDLLLQRLQTMLENGTTLVETKSGYGLKFDTELKMLKVIHSASKKIFAPDLVANYLGAHSVPKGSTAEEATQDIVQKQIPALVAAKESGEISAEFIDVFCEKGVFETSQSREILQAGKDAGFSLNFHGDELHPTKSAELGAELGATGISHLEWVSDDGIKAMAESGVVGVLLPTTAYILRIEPPPARKLIEGGVPVALGTDFNPNAYCMSMPFVMNLACVTMRMTPNEALVASTINAAASMDRSSSHGSLAVGKFTDFVVVDAPHWEHLIYRMSLFPLVASFASMNRSSTHGSLEVGKFADFVVVDAPRWEHLIYRMTNSPIDAVYKNGKRVVGEKSVSVLRE